MSDANEQIWSEKLPPDSGVYWARFTGESKAFPVQLHRGRGEDSISFMADEYSRSDPHRYRFQYWPTPFALPPGTTLESP